MNIPSVFWLVPIASIAALGMAAFFFRQMMKEDEGTPRMREIALYVRKGAMAYLKQQYKVVGIVFAVLCALFAFMAYGLNVQNPWVPFAFLTGGLFSGLAGFFGMKTATYASARTANAARKSLDGGLKVAFRSGAVMGLTVVGLGLLDIALWFLVLNGLTDDNLITITTTMLTFGMGASTQALFARVGGGIYTKAADVGADIVGKVEADIPEDDPRNPATIADNVGDNVGDVAGMGADLYESYCGSVLSTAALGASAFAASAADGVQIKAVLAPMLIAAVGVFLSLIGIFLVRTKEGATMRDLLRSLSIGTNVSAVLIAVATFGILYVLGLENWLGLSLSVISGLAAGVIIGQATEYYTSHSYKPTQKISEAGQTGAATVIIKGIGTGMISTCIPVITIGVAIILSFGFANGFDLSMSSESLAHGLYGIGIAAVGMLSTLGITLATDAYGPIADNAGGNAEMSELGEEVRHRTDALDALGNTTAATGKGFAIGSAALTALALLASYIEEIKIAMERAGVMMENVKGEVISASQATIPDFMNYFQVNLMNPKVLVGAFIGAMAAFLFCGLTMEAVGRAAQKMVEEVRRQFR
ncbi:MAG: sodium-translocating pyrophosphatase, partial [Prevotella sp.]|nr:sodium-translocating pyrophosphatase [Prevotella sp.]